MIKIKRSTTTLCMCAGCALQSISQKPSWHIWRHCAFGAPTPFLKEGRDRFNKLPIDCLNIIHGYEFTRYVPPYDLGFRYAGRMEWLPEPRIHKVFYKIRDHFPSNTTKAIKKWCQKHNDPSGTWACDQILKVARP